MTVTSVDEIGAADRTDRLGRNAGSNFVRTTVRLPCRLYGPTRRFNQLLYERGDKRTPDQRAADAKRIKEYKK